MKRYYVLQIYAGYEDEIKADIERRVLAEGVSEFFGEVLIPSAKIQSMFDAVASKQDHQLFPGYLLVEIDPQPDIVRIIENAPRVVRFLGGAEPMPLSDKEIDRVKAQMTGDVAIAPKEALFSVGHEIEIKDGPFSGFFGIIERVDDESERLVVNVSIFGRMTPVELGFSQVKY